MNQSEYTVFNLYKTWNLLHYEQFSCFFEIALHVGVALQATDDCV